MKTTQKNKLCEHGSFRPQGLPQDIADFFGACNCCGQIKPDNTLEHPMCEHCLHPEYYYPSGERKSTVEIEALITWKKRVK